MCKSVILHFLIITSHFAITSPSIRFHGKTLSLRHRNRLTLSEYLRGKELFTITIVEHKPCVGMEFSSLTRSFFIRLFGYPEKLMSVYEKNSKRKSGKKTSVAIITAYESIFLFV